MPDDLWEADPNAYAFIDDQRNVQVDNTAYQIARLRLFRVETDSFFPLGELKPA